MRQLVSIVTFLMLMGCQRIGVEWHVYRAASLASSGKGSEAVAEYREAANLGDHNAMKRLGAIYISGAPGLTVDRSKAESWFLRCAEQKHVDCMEMLALLYWIGFDGKKDLKKAEEWLIKAKENGSVEAARSLSDLRSGRPPSRGLRI